MPLLKKDTVDVKLLIFPIPHHTNIKEFCPEVWRKGIVHLVRTHMFSEKVVFLTPWYAHIHVLHVHTQPILKILESLWKTSLLETFCRKLPTLLLRMYIYWKRTFVASVALILAKQLLLKGLIKGYLLALFSRFLHF